MKSKQLTEKKIQEYLSHIDSHDINHAFYILKLIRESSTEGHKAIRQVFELSETTKTDKSISSDCIISKEQREELLRKYASYVLTYLKVLVESRPSVDDFYVQLWKFIDQNELLPTEETKALALYLFWNDVRLPYFEFNQDGQMSSEEFTEIRHKIALEISKARFALYLPCELRTETAANLVGIINGLKDEKEKQVLVAAILAHHEKMCSKDDDEE